MCIGRRGGFLAPGGIKRESGPSVSRTGASSAPTIKREKGETKTSYGQDSSYIVPRYPDEDEDLPRIDIQHINLISSEDEDDSLSPTPSRSKHKSPAGNGRGGLKPIRLDRHEHRERTSQVSTGPAVKDTPPEDESEHDTPVVDEERSTRATRTSRQRGARGIHNDGIQIKDEPQDATSSLDEVAPSRDIQDEEDTDDSEVDDQQTTKTRLRKKPAGFVIQTEEDRNEWERHIEDLEVLKEELGGMQQDLLLKGKEKANEDDAEAEKPADKKEGRLYLFQFPPAMPNLFNPASVPKRDPGVPANAGDGDVQVTGSRDNKVVDLDKTVKPEEEEIIKREDDEPTTKTKESLAAEEGYVGKLIVRESGRVELDWGGSRMLVGRGIETSFLSMGVLVDSKGCLDETGKPTKEGTATGMGKIMGKFLVTPDWESMVDDIERGEKRERRK